MPASGGAGEQKEKKKKRERNKRCITANVTFASKSFSLCVARFKGFKGKRGGDLEIHICWTNHPLPPYHRWKLGRWKKTIFIYLYIYFFSFAPLDEYLTRPSFIFHGKTR